MNTFGFSWATKCIVVLLVFNSFNAAAQPRKLLLTNDTLASAKYSIALARTLKDEGGYSNKKSNIGGETYCGITRKNYPKWEGWAIIDKHKPLKFDEQLPELDQMVAVFYKKYFWDEIRGDEIKSQDYASKLFDNAVKRGIERGIMTAQRNAGTKPTGIMDDATIIAINKKHR